MNKVAGEKNKNKSIESGDSQTAAVSLTAETTDSRSKIQIK